MNIKPLLKYKNLGIKIDSLGQTGFNFPKGASTVDLVMGISKKGDFQISTIRDNSRNILKREFSFKDDKGNLDFIEKIYEKTLEKFSTITNYKHNNKNITKKYINYSGDDDLFVMSKEVLAPDIDFHSIGLYRKGNKPKKLEYNWNWDDFKPNIMNNDKNLSVLKDNIEILPILISADSMERINERVKHISKIFEKKHNIQGIPHQVERIDKEKLNSLSLKEETLGLTTIMGDIFIDENKIDSSSIYDILSHEYQHMNDFINIFRTKKIFLSVISTLNNTNENFKQFLIRCSSKGFWPENSKEEKTYTEMWLNYLKQNFNHTDYLEIDLEKRAFAEQKKSIEILNNFYKKLVEYLV